MSQSHAVFVRARNQHSHMRAGTPPGCCSCQVSRGHGEAVQRAAAPLQHPTSLLLPARRCAVLHVLDEVPDLLVTQPRAKRALQLRAQRHTRAQAGRQAGRQHTHTPKLSGLQRLQWQAAAWSGSLPTACGRS